MNFEQQLHEEGLLPLYTATDLTLLPIVEKVLIDNGLHFIEVTYRSDKASQAIRILSESGKLIVGAGTVCDLKTAEDAIKNGAQFIVMPGILPEVVEYCLKKGVAVIPGAVTPAEIMQAIDLGLETVKFFPADIYGGVNTLKALGGPFPNIKFVPTGGVSSQNVQEFLELPSVLAVGGSFIISEKIVKLDEGQTASENLKAIRKAFASIV